MQAPKLVITAVVGKKMWNQLFCFLDRPQIALHSPDLLPGLSSTSVVHLKGIYRTPVLCGACLLLLESLNIGDGSYQWVLQQFQNICLIYKVAFWLDPAAFLLKGFKLEQIFCLDFGRHVYFLIPLDSRRNSWVKLTILS